MSDIAISVQNLSKSYLVGHNAKSERYSSLRDILARNARDLARKTRDMLSGRAIIQGDEVEEFWALKDVSFEIKHGDRVGIIGRNGAGKSTLLKILSRITEPTTGRIKISRRVASLLEVGTGFHPELTGRENVFLNGAILGMTRKEIQSKFEQIVDFAEVEKFLDTPVKRYSSGMYVRLAFAVAAHLEPEILVVDEVLAVGDAAFQKKCLGKMEETGKEGRTVLFVSHNMAAVSSLCTRSILLSQGFVQSDGNTKDVTEEYIKLGIGATNSHRIRESTDNIYIDEWRINGACENGMALTSAGEEFQVEIEVNNKELSINVAMGIAVDDKFGTRLFGCLSSEHGKIFHLPIGRSTLRCHIQNTPLNVGQYALTVAIHSYPSGKVLDRLNNCHYFDVLDSGGIVSKNNGLMVVRPVRSKGGER